MKDLTQILAIIIIASIYALATSCEDSENSKSENNTVISNQAEENNSKANPNLQIADSLADLFISTYYSDEELNRDSINIMYIREDSCYFENTRYTCYSIGFDLGFRFQVNNHLYVDVARRRSYLYDVVEDKLELWLNE